MPRIARIVVPGIPHHITQRGNNQQEVFLSDDDRRVYLHCLGEHAKESGLTVLAYCLMPNHVHIVGTPSDATSLARVIGRAHLQYTHYANETQKRSGHLWQNRFYSCPMDPEHTVAAMRYVERNPVCAGLANHAWEYPWSSAGAHVGERAPHALLDLRSWSLQWDSRQWRQLLQDADDGPTYEGLRRAISTGRPAGGDEFLNLVERQTGATVRARPAGRPRLA